MFTGPDANPCEHKTTTTSSSLSAEKTLKTTKSTNLYAAQDQSLRFHEGTRSKFRSKNSIEPKDKGWRGRGARERKRKPLVCLLNPLWGRDQTQSFHGEREETAGNESLIPNRRTAMDGHEKGIGGGQKYWTPPLSAPRPDPSRWIRPIARQGRIGRWSEAHRSLGDASAGRLAMAASDSVTNEAHRRGNKPIDRMGILLFLPFLPLHH